MTSPATTAYRHAKRAGEIAYAIQHGYITGKDVPKAQARAKDHADKAAKAASDARARGGAAREHAKQAMAWAMAAMQA